MRWSAQFHTPFHVWCATQEHPRALSDFNHGAVTLSGRSFQSVDLSSKVSHRSPTTPWQKPGFGLIRFRSPLLTESNSLSTPLVTEMFHFTRYRVSFPILFRKGRLNINPVRLPHSEIAGSKVVCTLPTLIAAYHVLHRLLVPRHPLCALYNLIPFRNLLLRRTRSFQKQVLQILP